MSEGRWIGLLSVGWSQLGFRGLLTKVWACKGKIEEWYSLRVVYWGYSRRYVFQSGEFGKPHVSPLLLYRLLDVSQLFLLMHQNPWAALSTGSSGSNSWRISPGRCNLPQGSSHKDLPGQEVTPLCSHQVMTGLKHHLISKLPCSWRKVSLSHIEALPGFAVPIILGSGCFWLNEELLGFQQK